MERKKMSDAKHISEILNEGLINSVKFMRGQGVAIKKIAKELKIGVGTVYKVMESNDMEKVA